MLRKDHLRRLLLCFPARIAENGATALGLRTRLERHLARCTALRTHCIELLAVCAIVLTSGAAILAALRGIQVLGGVELLFTLRERECGTAIAAGDLLISHTKNRKKE